MAANMAAEMDFVLNFYPKLALKVVENQANLVKRVKTRDICSLEHVKWSWKK